MSMVLSTVVALRPLGRQIDATAKITAGWSHPRIETTVFWTRRQGSDCKNKRNAARKADLPPPSVGGYSNIYSLTCVNVGVIEEGCRRTKR